MASRHSFGKQLVARARYIGWQVDNLPTGGWVITCSDNHRVQVHMTPSDVNAEQHVVQELNRHGFAKAEEEFSRLDEDKRLERLQNAREQNQRRLDAAQKAADALAKAATGRTRVPSDVLLSAQPVPKTFERVLVTPELASQLLDLNTDNRPIRKAEVAQWIDVIERGAWHYTHQGIAIDSNGILQDGQHRLTAIVRTDIPVEVQISVGMPPENFSAIDNGLRRNFRDVADRLHLPNPSKVGSAARTLIIFSEYPNRMFNDKVNNAEVAEFLAAPYYDTDLSVGEMVHRAVNEAQMHWHSYRINNNAMTALAYKLWELVGKDDPKVVEFLEGLKSGVNFTKTDPRLALRRVTNSPSNNVPRTTAHHLALGIKAWNKYAKGDQVQLLAYRAKVEDFPKIYIPGNSSRG